jgi:thiol-disulfide isomerase/thioredoxin
MVKKIATILLTALFILACQPGNKKKIKEFSHDYTAIQEKYREKLKTAPRSDYMMIMNEKVEELEKLLKKHENSPAVDEIEILRGKVLLQLSKVDEAEKKIDTVIKNNSTFIDDAKMVKVQILFLKRDINEAYEIFKEIEAKMERGEDLFSAYLYFSLFAEDLQVREDYSNKFLNSSDLPEDLETYKSRIYSSLAAVAKERMQLDKAKEYLNKAIEMEKDPRTKLSFQAERASLDFIGKPAPAISPDTWINSSPLDLEKLKGKVVVIDFWATWCKPCRMIMPALTEAYTNYKDQGLVVIGLTKLYSSYSDELGSRGEVSKTGEIALIKEFVTRNKLDYPTAICHEGIEFEKYKISAIPTMVFINKEGTVAHIEMGAGSPQEIKHRIKKLLEE